MQALPGVAAHSMINEICRAARAACCQTSNTEHARARAAGHSDRAPRSRSASEMQSCWLDKRREAAASRQQARERLAIQAYNCRLIT